MRDVHVVGAGAVKVPVRPLEELLLSENAVGCRVAGRELVLRSRCAHSLLRKISEVVTNLSIITYLKINQIKSRSSS